MMQGLRGSGESMPQKTTKKKQQDSKEEGEVCVLNFGVKGTYSEKQNGFFRGDF